MRSAEHPRATARVDASGLLSVGLSAAPFGLEAVVGEPFRWLPFTSAASKSEVPQGQYEPWASEAQSGVTK